MPALRRVLVVAPLLLVCAAIATPQTDSEVLATAPLERDLDKRIDLLNSWRARTAAQNPVVLEMLLQAYRVTGRDDAAYATALELKSLEPGNLPALYYLAKLPTEKIEPTAALLLEAEQHAAALRAVVSATPPQQRLLDLERQAVLTDVWVALQRKEINKAERLLTQHLRLHPEDALASYELGKAILATKLPERRSEALHHIGRAAYLEGATPLNPKARTQVRNWFEKVVDCRGRHDELPEMEKIVRTYTFPTFTLDFSREGASPLPAACSNRVELVTGN